MGFLDGFGVTFKQLFERRGHHPVPGGEAAEARALPRPPRPQPLRGRHGEVHRLRAVRRRLPGPVHLRPRRRQPARRAGVAGRALRLRLRDQLPALHPLRPVRRGVPDRGHHRDEAVRVLLHQPPGRHLHQGTSCWSTTTASPSSCRGRTGGRATTRTPRRGCGPRRRPATPRYEGRVQWSGELGYGVRPPETGPEPATSRGRTRVTLAARRAPSVDTGRVRRCASRHRAGRRVRRGPRAQPGALPRSCW